MSYESFPEEAEEATTTNLRANTNTLKQLSRHACLLIAASQLFAFTAFAARFFSFHVRLLLWGLQRLVMTTTRRAKPPGWADSGQCRDPGLCVQ